jgi:hypothetical protein
VVAIAWVRSLPYSDLAINILAVVWKDDEVVAGLVEGD